MLVTDTPFEYSVDWNRRRGRCRLRSFDTPTGRVVVFTELAENPGPSVTNAALELVHQAAEAFGFSIEETVWIEEYGPESYHGGSRDRAFARIHTGSSGPRWQNMPCDLVLQLTGMDQADFR